VTVQPLGGCFTLNAAILFSGGKDSMLATQLSLTHGHQVRCLVSFICERNGLFDALNIPFAETAAKCMQLPLQEFKLNGSTDMQFIGLREALLQIKKQFGIQLLVTGAGTNSPAIQKLEQLSREIGLTPWHPLLGVKQKNVLYAALKNRYKVLFVKTDGYKALLGQVFDEKNLSEDTSPELLDRAASFGTGSVIIDAPLFNKKIKVQTSEPVQEGTVARLLITGIVLENK